MSDLCRIRIGLTAADDVDAEELQGLTRSLRRALLDDIDADDVRPVAGPPPPDGAKSGTTEAAGVLLVTMGPAVLKSVLHTVEVWMQNRPLRKISLEIDGRTLELSAASRKDQQRVIQSFFAEHDRPVQPAESVGDPAEPADSGPGSSTDER